MMADKWTPKVVWGPIGSLITLNLNAPLPPWQIDDKGEGGYDVAASGIPESYEIRYDYARRIRLPFFESEYVSVQDWIRWAMRSSDTFDFTFDATDVLTEYEMYLDEPTIKDGFKPQRDRYSGLFWLDLRLRAANGEPITVNFSGI